MDSRIMQLLVQEFQNIASGQHQNIKSAEMNLKNLSKQNNFLINLLCTVNESSIQLPIRFQAVIYMKNYRN